MVGAGPAGALAAHLHGRVRPERVLLVEKKRFPRSKVCGACLNGQAMAVLQSAGLGSLVARLGGIELEEFEVRFRGRTARLATARRRRPLPGAARCRAGGCGDGCGRTSSCKRPRPPWLKSEMECVRCGSSSRDGRSRRRRASCWSPRALAGTVGTEPPTRTPRSRRGSRIGAGCQVADAPDFYGEHTIFMAVGRAGYVGVVRVEDGSLNVAAAFDPAFVRRLGTPGSCRGRDPRRGRVRHRSPRSKRLSWQGTARLTRRTRPLAEDRLFLLGDAAGYVEPFTGEGIAWALASAQAIAPLALQAIERWDPRLARPWSTLHRRLIGRRQLVCRAVRDGAAPALA